MKILSQIKMVPGMTILDGNTISTLPLNELYRQFVGDYPKFFKMDSLCKLGFLASELLLGSLSAEQKENASIILFNKNGSLISDRNYQQTISDSNFFPSPALFVYTLANIITGEIAIRHKIYGETSFYILPNKDEEVMERIVKNIFLTSHPTFVLTGWVDYENGNEYLAEIKIITK